MKRIPRRKQSQDYIGPHPHTEVRIRSATAVIRALLQLGDALYIRHRTRFLTNCLWQITQAEGRDQYDLRYRSLASRTAPRKELRHEHVYRRKDMIRDLIDHPDSIDDIVAKAIGCVVTKAEHTRLDKVDRESPEVDGWRRDQLAEIDVIDMSTGHRMAYDQMLK
jgi:hypothetical protein